MHRALEVLDILHTIFQYIDNRGDIAALARTCRWFRPLADAVLWSALEDISPLIKFLPLVMQHDDYHRHAAQPTALPRAFVYHASHVRNLRITTAVPVGILTLLARTCQELRILAILSTGLEEDGLLFLADLLYLRVLTIRLTMSNKELSNVSSRLPQQSFRSLSHLSITAPTAFPVNAFAPQIPSLRSCDFTLSFSSPEHLQKLFKHLLTVCRDIQRIAVYTDKTRMYLSNISRYRLQLETLQPLLSLHELRKLHMEGCGVFELPHDQFCQMVHAWPHLEQLVLQSTISEPSDAVIHMPTFASLLYLIEHCTALQDCFGPTFRVDDILTLSPRELKNDRIDRIRMTCSRTVMKSADKLAEVIYGVLPNLRHIMDEDEEHENEKPWWLIMLGIRRRRFPLADFLIFGT
jgi:hypothetical protein